MRLEMRKIVRKEGRNLRGKRKKREGLLNDLN